MGMTSLPSLSRLLFLALCLTAAPAAALPVTVFWDRADFGGYGAGLGVSQATANSAQTAGVPIIQPGGLRPLSAAGSPEIGQSIASVALGDPANITENWSALNDTGASLQNLYLLFMQPEPGTITLAGQSQSVTYEPADVGLTLGADWVIFQVDVNSNSVYYPAVSLGNLANGANAAFPLFYVLDDPQVFREPFPTANYELGMPKWKVSFVVIPEPASGVLVLFGLLGIVGGRRNRS